MLFALITLLSALSLAGVAGWFSIIGITSIYAGAPFHALVMGAVLEGGKLVTTSWLYRNWTLIDWRLKAPLIFFTITLMVATSIGVFGFLSKAHLEQGAGTVDNTAKVERLDEQIAREKSTIADDSRVISQLDATINSYLGKDRADRSVIVRKKQDSERNQLRSDINAAQKRIDGFSDEKFKLTSEVRKLQLDVGPIRYIAELVYGTDGNAEKNIESAVRMFTLIIVSTLDPLAVVLLIAANHTILRRQNEKKRKEDETDITSRNESSIEALTEPSESSVDAGHVPKPSKEDSAAEIILSSSIIESKEAEMDVPVLQEPVEDIDENQKILVPTSGETEPVGADVSAVPGISEKMEEIIEPKVSETSQVTWPAIPKTKEATLKDYIADIVEEEKIILPIIRSPALSHVFEPHFIPQKLNEEEIPGPITNPSEDGKKIDEIAPRAAPATIGAEEVSQEPPTENSQTEEGTGLPNETIRSTDQLVSTRNRSRSYPTALSWLNEFKRNSK